MTAAPPMPPTACCGLKPARPDNRAGSENTTNSTASMATVTHRADQRPAKIPDMVIQRGVRRRPKRDQPRRRRACIQRQVRGTCPPVPCTPQETNPAKDFRFTNLLAYGPALGLDISLPPRPSQSLKQESLLRRGGQSSRPG
jgi:hypothetical protein